MSIQNKKGVKILLCPDKFKGSLSSAQASNAIEMGLLKRASSADNYPIPEFAKVAIADGGDGSQEIIENLYKAQKVAVKTYNATGDEITGEYLLYNTNNKKNAFIEMAKICGLAMLDKSLRNPLYTSTYGLGIAIKDALEKGAEVITLSIGGSATNDGGIGMLESFGVEFFGEDGKHVGAAQENKTFLSGKDLEKIRRIEYKNPVMPQGVEFRVICDVSNPLLGENGATYVYGPQKGADSQMLRRLEQGMANYVSSNERTAHYANVPGAGAAGGVGFACIAYLNATLISGWKFFAEITLLEEKIKWADLVITGEGSIDSQSLQGKVIDGVLTIAQKYNKSVAAFCGVSKLGKTDNTILKCYQITSLENNIEKCMTQAESLLKELAFTAGEELLANFR